MSPLKQAPCLSVPGVSTSKGNQSSRTIGAKARRPGPKFGMRRTLGRSPRQLPELWVFWSNEAVQRELGLGPYPERRGNLREKYTSSQMARDIYLSFHRARMSALSHREQNQGVSHDNTFSSGYDLPSASRSMVRGHLRVCLPGTDQHCFKTSHSRPNGSLFADTASGQRKEKAPLSSNIQSNGHKPPQATDAKPSRRHISLASQP